jgi:uncharacterized protein (TIGR02246 family)
LDEEVRKAVEKSRLKYVAAVHEGDAIAMAAQFTEDAILMPLDHEMVHGRKEVQKFWEEDIQSGLKDVIITTMELSGSGDTIHEVGHTTVTISQKGQKPRDVKLKYIFIWKHDASGWKIHRFIYNRNTPSRK